MTEYTGPFDDGAGSGITEATWLILEGNVFPYHGYVYGVLNQLAVSQHAPIAAMSVDVATGAGIIGSSRYMNSALQTLTIDSVTPGKNRIDSVVLRRTIAAPASTTTIAVLKGTEANPGAEVAPTLTQVLTGVYELRLANILIASGTTAITTAMITDKRDSTDCGVYMPAVGKLGVNKATGNITTNGFDLEMSTTGQIHNLADPTGNQDADTKGARDAAIAAYGGSFVATGTFLTRTFISSGSTDYAPINAGVKKFKIIAIGAGGNGGAAGGAGSSYYGAPGGGSGGYTEVTIPGTSTASISYVIGAVGSNTVITTTAGTHTASCGSTETPGMGSGGTINLSGQPGFMGSVATNWVASGAGGASLWGYGGGGQSAASLNALYGSTALGLGCGGGGALVLNSTAARTGGAGMGGLCIIEEWG